MEQQILCEALANTLEKFFNNEEFVRMSELWRGELRVLFYLYKNNKQRIYPCNISTSLHLSRPRITNILTVLIKKGYANVEISNQDRRMSLVKITSKGEDEINRLKNKFNETTHRVIDKMGEADAKRLIQLMDRFIEAI